MPVEKINWDKHDVVTCDERGRATLGTEYANERVFVYVSELPETDDLGEELPKKQQRVLSKMLKWANDNDIDTLTHLLDPFTGVVTDKDGNKHDSPYNLAAGDVKPCPACEGDGERELGPCSICRGSGRVIVDE